jgi:hypothetical protein
MWLCPECDETIDDPFDVCWNCGTDQAGIKDLEFRHADEHPVIYSESPPKIKKTAQFGLLSLLVSMTCLAIIFSVVAKGGGPLLAGVLLVLGATAVVLLTILHIYGLLYAVLLTCIRNRHPHRAASPSRPAHSDQNQA